MPVIWQHLAPMSRAYRGDGNTRALRVKVPVESALLDSGHEFCKVATARNKQGQARSLPKSSLEAVTAPAVGHHPGRW
jgi:hypothetical protein